MSAIIFGWIAAGTYASSQHLEQPVFLDHYFKDYADEQLQMQFYYLTNSGDNKTINFVELGDIPAFVDGYHEMFMEGTPYVQRYGPHELRTVSVTLDSYELSQLKEKVTVNEMTVYLSDGESFVADIGEIIIYPEELSAKTYVSQNSSSGDWTASYLQAEEKISILGMNPHIPDAVLESMKVHVPQSEDMIFSQTNYVQALEEQLNDGKGKEYQDLDYPVNLDKGEGFAISIQNKGDAKFVLDSWLMIEGEDQNGSVIQFPAYLYHIPQLTGKNVKAIIESKGAGE
ncbi:MAG TPA: hypothetical protein VK945_00460 [Planococcus sp. (in: firmicutes)]|nr:hypothetical protein [Planococcus sp. (in: firmicutes)]